MPLAHSPSPNHRHDLPKQFAPNTAQLLAILVISLALANGNLSAGELAGVNIVPHQIDKELKYAGSMIPLWPLEFSCLCVAQRHSRASIQKQLRNS